MEFITFSSLFVFLLFIIFLLHKVVPKTNPRKKQLKLLLPPGPKQFPIIGNLHQLPGGGRGQMHHILRDLSKKYGHLMYLKLGEIQTIVISSPEMAKEIYKTHDILFSDRPTNDIKLKILSYNFSNVAFSPYGTYWKVLRKICVSELLTPKRVKSFQSIREEEVLKMIKSINISSSSSSNKMIINFSEKVVELAFTIISRIAIGKRNKFTKKKIEELITQTARLTGIFYLSDLYPSWKFIQIFSGVKRQLEIVHSEIDEIFEDIVKEHKYKLMEKSKSKSKSSVENYKDDEIIKEDKEEDIVDVLVRIQKNGDSEVPLGDTNIKGLIFDMFSGASETSGATLEWAMSEMIKNSRILKKAQEEVRNMYNGRGNVDESNLEDLKYLQAIIKETLRLHPPSPLIGIRENKESCEINGYYIPPYSRVFVNGYAIGRDPNFWGDEAEVFKPERFLHDEFDFSRGNHDMKFIPFGAGRRICPGINFAQPSLLLSLAQLLFHFDWEFPGKVEEELDMEEGMGIFLRRKNDLKLIPIPYSGSSLE